MHTVHRVRVIGHVLTMFVSFGMMTSASDGASFQSLGYLPGGIFLQSSAYAVSADGSTVVGTSQSSNGLEAFRWTASSGIIGLGDLPGGGFRSIAYGVSADGSVVVGQAQPKDTPENVFADSEAFRWTEVGGMQSLGNLPGGEFGSAANAVSDDGLVIVGIADAFNDHDGEAFRWTESDGMVGLGDLRPGSSTVSSAWGTSGDGEIIVGETGVEVGRQAFAWSNPGGMTALEPFPGEGNWDRATALSLDGSVIVGVGNHGSFVNNTQAFRWTVADGYVGLGDLPGGSFQSAATDVSADGSVIVGFSRTDSMVGLRTEAFIWTETTGIKKLQDTLENDFGLVLSGWTLSEATSISADGRTIVGTGRNPAGEQEAWVIMLNVPEPGTAYLILSAFITWLGHGIKRVRTIFDARK